tara:strand:- start:9752 stop:10132 length:381 start_codon:yes stop_codon:yes gene_type:complete
MTNISNFLKRDKTIKYPEYILFMISFSCSLTLLFNQFAFLPLAFFVSLLFSTFFETKIINYKINSGFILGYFISFISKENIVLFLPLEDGSKLEFLVYFFGIQIIFFTLLFLLSEIFLFIKEHYFK